MPVQNLDYPSTQGLPHFGSFPRTSGILADMILNCYARPTPWMTPRSEEHFRQEILNAYAYLKHCAEHGCNAHFFSELSRLIREVILVDLLGASTDVYKACKVILNCRGHDVQNGGIARPPRLRNSGKISVSNVALVDYFYAWTEERVLNA